MDDFQQAHPPLQLDRAVELKKTQLKLITQANFERGEADAFVERLQRERQQYWVDEIELKHNIYQLLTTEQQEQFKQGLKELITSYN